MPALHTLEEAEFGSRGTSANANSSIQRRTMESSMMCLREYRNFRPGRTKVVYAVQFESERVKQ
jgi:hypothetical protein